MDNYRTNSNVKFKYDILILTYNRLNFNSNRRKF